MNSETHFNATELIRQLKPGSKLKPANFLDNDNIKCKITLPSVIKRGKNGYTLIQNELRLHFLAWLDLQK